ncbi:MAG: EthD domain-containing protein, partial [Burkholderiales bacterium]|nr:EthD domain-containing protein [Burkholderiales bacterium]
MIKFVLAARRKREDTQERYFYEWGIIHVALMITCPGVMQTFRRYVQHYSVSGIDDSMLIHPLSKMEWDNFADHVVDDFAGFQASTRLADYVARMQPHKFGDGNFVAALTVPETVIEEPGFESGVGGVKLLHFLKRKAGTTQAEFAAAFTGSHAAMYQRLNAQRPLLRKYLRNLPLDVPRDNFKGSLFEKADLDAVSGIEEFWFRNLDDLLQFRRDAAWHDAIRASEAGFIDDAGSFSMVTTERVIYDYTRGAQSSPRAAVLDPA